MTRSYRKVKLVILSLRLLRFLPGCRFSQELDSRLLLHYEAVEQLKSKVQPNIMTRVIMLPEGVVREIRRADPEYWAVRVKAYFKSVDEGKPLGVAGVVAPRGRFLPFRVIY